MASGVEEGLFNDIISPSLSISNLLFTHTLLSSFFSVSFGSWKEEVTEDDMLCLQGVEAVDNILFGGPETVVSKPSLVHSMYRSTLSPVISPEMSLLPASVYFLDWEFAIAKTCEDNLMWLSELLLELFGNQMTALGKFKVFIYEPSTCTAGNSVREGGAYWENLNHVHKVSIPGPSLEKEFTTVAYLTHLLSRRGKADEGDISVFLTGDLHRIKADLAITSSSSEGVSSLAKTLRFISKANSLRQHFSYIGGSFTSLDCPTASTQIPEELKGSSCGDLCSIYDVIMRRDGDCPQKITSYQNSGFYVSK
jgi:hypothetical protein